MIKTLTRSIREFKKMAILTPLLVTVEVVLECIIPFIIANLVNQMQAGCSMDVIVRYGIQLVVMAVLSLLFGIAAGSTCATASTGFARNLRQDMFYHIQDYSFSNIDKFSVSSLVTRMTTDVVNVQMSFMMIIRVAIRGPLMLIFSFIMGFAMGGRLATIFLVTIPLLSVGLVLVIRKATPIFRRVFRKYDALNDSVQENVQAMRVVKSYVHEEYEKKKFAAAAEDVCKDFTRAERIMALNNPMMQFCVYAGMAFVLSYGSYEVITSRGMEVAVGQMSAILTYSFQILMSLMMLSMVFVMVTQSAAAAQRIEEVLEEQPDITSPENAVKTVKDGSIDFDHVTFAYQQRSGKPVLSDIDLHIQSGETIGIMGGTGSSKSSLVNLISRLYDVTAGEVRVGGVDVRRYDVESLRDAVSVVLQNNVLFSGTIYDNLRWGDKNATDEQCREACHLACADEFIERFPEKYDTRIERGGTNVSGGQKQRLCIARALLKKPKVLILDDSTSAVDTATDAKIREAMRTHIPGTTKIIIAQRISSIQDADRVLVLDNGRVNAFDTPENLLKTNAIYQEVYNSQVGNGGGDFDEAAMKGGD